METNWPNHPNRAMYEFMEGTETLFDQALIQTYYPETVKNRN